MMRHGNHCPYRTYKNQKNQIGSSPPQYRSAPCRHSGEDCITITNNLRVLKTCQLHAKLKISA